NLKPLLRSSLLILSDSPLVGGTWPSELNSCLIGLPPMNPHTYLSKDPNSFRVIRNCLAFVMVASTLRRLRMISGWPIKRLTSLLLMHAILAATQLCTDLP